MRQGFVKKILEHPDRDEIISKLIASETPDAINTWLRAKYSDNQLILSTDSLKKFKAESLDMYLHLREDIIKIKAASPEVELDKTIKNNKKYKERLAELVDQEIDIKTKIKQLVAAIEVRVESVFDHLQDNPTDFKVDNSLIQYFNLLINALNQCDKIVNQSPDHIVQHNHTIQLADKQTAVIIDTIKDVLSRMDYEASLYFMEQYNERMNLLKSPDEVRLAPTEIRLAEVKSLAVSVGENTED